MGFDRPHIDVEATVDVAALVYRGVMQGVSPCSRCGLRHEIGARNRDDPINVRVVRAPHAIRPITSEQVGDQIQTAQQLKSESSSDRWIARQTIEISATIGDSTTRRLPATPELRSLSA